MNVLVLNIRYYYYYTGWYQMRTKHNRDMKHGMYRMRHYLSWNNNNKGKEAEIKKSWEARLGKHDRVKGYKWKKSTL